MNISLKHLDLAAIIFIIQYGIMRKDNDHNYANMNKTLYYT